MVYVQRDENGRLVRIEREPFAGGQGAPADDPEVLA